METMMSIYLGSFLFGGILISTSIFFGDAEGDGDMDKDLSMDKDFSFDKDISFDPDIDGDIDVEGIDGLAWLPFLSLRFWTFGLGLFGLSGILLTLLKTGEPLTLGVAIGLGILLGYPIAYLFQKLKYNSVTSETSLKGLKKELGRTLLPMQPQGKGKIRVKRSGELIDLIAVSNDPTPIEQDQEVLITSVREGLAYVTAIPQGEQNTPEV